jgi:hypothetical protein
MIKHTITIAVNAEMKNKPSATKSLPPVSITLCYRNQTLLTLGGFWLQKEISSKKRAIKQTKMTSAKFVKT